MFLSMRYIVFIRLYFTFLNFNKRISLNINYKKNNIFVTKLIRLL